MSRLRVVVLGASGQGKVVADVLEQAGTHDVVGFVDAAKPAGTTWYGLPVLGTEQDLPELWRTHGVRGGTLGIGDNAVRAAVAARVSGLLPDFAFVPAVHPTAVVARGARLGQGVRLMAGAFVGADCVLGDHVTVDTGASLDHDGTLGLCASLGPQVVTGGNVVVGDGTAVSIGTTVLHGRTIGAHTVVGAGSLVVKDLPSHVVAYGSPARVVRSRAEGERYL